MSKNNIRPAGPSDNKKRRANPLAVVALTVLVVILLGGITAFWGLRYFGRQDLLSRIPLVGRYFAIDAAKPMTPEEELAAARAELESEQAALAAAQATVAQERQELAALRTELDAREASLLAAEAELAAAQAGQMSEQESIGRLARMTANMEPEEAVPILANLGEQLAVKVIAALSEKDGAAILAAMEPQAAARLLQAMHE